MNFSESVVVFDIENSRCCQLKEYIYIDEKMRFKFIHCPWLNATQIQYLQISFL